MATEFGRRIDQFLSQTISSVYRDGVSYVTDKHGNPPNELNNYLMSPDGDEFKGVFVDEKNLKKFAFHLTRNEDGWKIRY